MYGKSKNICSKNLLKSRLQGLYKSERIITSPQRAEIEVQVGRC